MESLPSNGSRNYKIFCSYLSQSKTILIWPLALVLVCSTFFCPLRLTSKGGLIILGLFLNLWTAEDCSNEFQALSKIAFQSRGLVKLLFLSSRFFRRVCEIISSCVTDSRYSSSGITSAVQNAFGKEKLLFGRSTDTKLAITGTTTGASYTVLFTNCNGAERSSSCGEYRSPMTQARCLIGTGYRLVRENCIEDEMHLWEM